MLRLVVLLFATACGRVDFANVSDAGVDSAPCTEPWGPPVELVYGYPEPSLTADELEMYLARAGDLFVMTRESRTTPWSDPQLLPSPPNSAYTETTPSISGDGLSLYFSSYQMGNAFIEVTRRASRGDAWSSPTHSGAYGGPEIRDDELEILTEDYMTPLRRATRESVSESFTATIDLDPIINDGSVNANPALSSDALELYFWSNRSGPQALYVARRAAISAPFTSVDALGINGISPDVSTDGHRLYFSLFTTGDYATFVSSRCE